MTTVVWIPYRGDGGWREANFDAAYRQASTLGFEVRVHDSGDQPFSIARTWNQLGEMGGWDRAVCWGADFVMVDPDTICAALAVDHHYVFAFDKVSTLNSKQTRQVWFEGPQPFPPSKLPFGGVRVISRAMWEDLGGYDPRFVGWGHEDRAFVHAMNLLWGPRVRVEGHMLNLWHPKPADLPNDPYFARRHENKAMWAEYRQITDPGVMRNFLGGR